MGQGVADESFEAPAADPGALAAGGGLRLRYLTPEEWAIRARAGGLLGAMVFGDGAVAAPPESCPFLRIALPSAEGRPVVEVWESGLPTEGWGEREGIRFIRDETYLFAAAQVPAGTGDLAPVAEALYGALFRLLEAEGYPALLRVFNYLPRILAWEDGEERYRRFNLGRHEAFAVRGDDIATAPAACALGNDGEMLSLAVIAGRRAGTPIENPRQISAYRYPPQYGPRSPTFSRALLTPGVALRGGAAGKGAEAAARALFISGTASIVAHESRHPGDVAAQLQETLRNLRALLAESGMRGGPAEAGRLRLKTYLRDLADAPTIRAGLAAEGFLSDGPMLQATICRPELLVEIEGFAPAP